MTTILSQRLPGYVWLIASTLMVSADAWVQQPRSTYNHRRSLKTTTTSRHALPLEFLAEPATQQAVQSTLMEHHAAAGGGGLVEQVATLLSTTMSSATATLQAGDLTITPNTLQPAHGHNAASSWFGGAVDPYLAAGKSIAPSAKGLTNLLAGGAQEGTTAAAGAVGAASNTQPLPEALQTVLNQGWKLLDARVIQQENFLPGFTPTGGILPSHQAPAETPASFALQVEWSARFLKVVDKLPEAAFFYALVEFFLLRPNIDLYKEEIRQEPGAVAVETLVTTAVRVAAFGIVAVVTLGIFG